MKTISVATALTLIDQSERTLRRRLLDEGAPKIDDPRNLNRTMLPYDFIQQQVVIPIEPDDLDLIVDADSGDVEAQNDLALLLMSHDKYQGALYWLELAAKQNYPDAMHWLARCYLEGNGVAKNEDIGMMWLFKAAANEHVISQAQVEAMKSSFTGKSRL